MANHKAHSNTQNTNMAAAAATSFMQKFSSPIISTATQSHVSPACLPVLVHSLPSRRLPGAALSGDARSSCLCSCLQQQQQQFSASPPRAASRTIACAATQSSRSNVDSVDVLQDLPTAAYGQVISAEANFVRVNISHLEEDQPSIHGNSSNGSNGTSSSNSSSPHTQQQQPAPAPPPPPPPPPVKQLLCTVRALLKKVGQRVLVGDRVRVSPIDWTAARGVVDAVQPRSSELADPAVANIDHVLLLFGLTQPPFEPAQVSRFLVSLGASGLPVTLALNKADLLPAGEIQQRLDQVAAWGYKAVAVSCESGLGLEALAQQLAGKVSVVAGPSGAGKSSLINALRLGRHKPDAAAAAAGDGGGVSQQQEDWGVEPHSAAAGVQWQYQQQDPQQQHQQQHSDVHWANNSSSSSTSIHLPNNHNTNTSSSSNTSSSTAAGGGFLAVGDVSKIGRGRHTTRTVTLIELPFGGLMADTPGFNQPTLDRVSSAELAGLFPEFVAAQQQQQQQAGGGGGGGCRFTDCMHLAEPGCAVTAADLERHEHYVKFLAEIKAREDFDVRVMQLTKQRREGAMKAKTGRGGATRYEARLNTKKHRSTSRRMRKQNVWDDAASDEAELQE